MYFISVFHFYLKYTFHNKLTICFAHTIQEMSAGLDDSKNHSQYSDPEDHFHEVMSVSLLIIINNNLVAAVIFVFVPFSRRVNHT